MNLPNDIDNHKPPDDREPPSAGPPKAAKKGLTTLSNVPMERIAWAWKPWIALGKLTLVVGPPAVNKTTLTQDLAARITTGKPMPLVEATDVRPADVIFYSCEDSLRDIIVPRLCAAGADTSRVHVYEEPIQLPRDIPTMEAHVGEKSARAVIIDSLMRMSAAHSCRWPSWRSVWASSSSGSFTRTRAKRGAAHCTGSREAPPLAPWPATS